MRFSGLQSHDNAMKSTVSKASGGKKVHVLKLSQHNNEDGLQESPLFLNQYNLNRVF